MPDRELLPPGRRLEPVALPPGALDGIRRRARARRGRRAAGRAGACLAVAAVAASLLNVTPPATDSLRVGPARAPAPAVSPTAAGVQVPPGDTGAPRRDLPADASPAASSAPGREAVLPTHRTAVAASAPPAPAGPSGRTSDGPVRTSSTRVVAGVGCNGVEVAQDRWCMAAAVDLPREQLQLQVCREQGARAERLTWSTSQQVAFSVVDSGGALRWSYDPQVRPDSASEEVLPGGCLTWALRWPAVDDRDQPLPAGRYELRARSTADSLRTVPVNRSFEVGDR